MLPGRQEVLSALHGGTDYPAAARALDVPAGLVYLTATGLPADGGDALAPEDLDRPGLLPGSTQHLANPPAGNPTPEPGTVHEWIRRRALTDGPMQEAAAARNAEPGQPLGADGDTSVTVVLGRDHGQINAMLEELSAIPGVRKKGSEADLSRRRSIVDMITVTASRHETVEEEHFWPRIRDVLPDGPRLAGQALDQEQKGAELLAELGTLNGGDERFDDLVEDLVASLRKHVALEDKVFLALQDALSDEDMQSWGDTIRRAEGQAEPGASRRGRSRGDR